MQNNQEPPSTNRSYSHQEKLSIGNASEYLGVSIDTLRRWEKKGRITALRSPGGHRYFIKDDLDKLFGKKYKRDTRVSRLSLQPEINQQTGREALPAEQQQTPTTFEPSPLQPTAPATEPEKKKYVVEELVTPPSAEPREPTVSSLPTVDQVSPQVTVSEQEKEKLDNILVKSTDGKLTKSQKIGLGAIIVFTIIDIILVLLWFSSKTIISPVP